MERIYNPRLFNPLYWHLLAALLDPRIRYIFIEGGSSAAKTFTICQALLNVMMELKFSVLAFRRFGVHIEDSVYNSFKEAAKSLQWEDYIDFLKNHARVKGKKFGIRFRGLDDEENLKGMEGFQVVYNNEWSQFLERHWDQQRKRLRGRPGQKFICDWNPISAKLWNYTNWIDKIK